jgi:hypothetical protein
VGKRESEIRPFPLERHGLRHSLRSRHAIACARPAVPVKAAEGARKGLALTGAGNGRARIETTNRAASLSTELIIIYVAVATAFGCKPEVLCSLRAFQPMTDADARSLPPAILHDQQALESIGQLG